MKHTKGPWRVENSENELEFAIMSKDDSHICNIHESNGGYANAQLIAAAPELLEALEQCLLDLESLAGDTRDSLCEARIKQAKQAISKARGSK